MLKRMGVIAYAQQHIGICRSLTFSKYPQFVTVLAQFFHELYENRIIIHISFTYIYSYIHLLKRKTGSKIAHKYQNLKFII